MTPLEWIFAIGMTLLALGAGAAFFILVTAFKMVRQRLEKHQ
ncbi:hypothetical protein ACQCP0_25635 [Ralstonia pseudosolanacearum]|nr:MULTISPECIES: hypothetical protein [Gammaproteobacteria]